MKSQTEMSERKRKIVEAYKSFAQKKLREIKKHVEKHNLLYEVSEIGELWKVANQEKLEKINYQISRMRQDHERAIRRSGRLVSNTRFSRYTSRFDWDSTDEENRSAIQDMHVEYGEGMEAICILKLHDDAVGSKLLNIAYETQEKISNREDETRRYVHKIGTVVDSPHFQIERDVWKNIEKMLDRTMSEQEYQHLARSTPKQLKKEWRKRK